jgi:exopolyphosphatase/guanosine-5'-triphosphate,3'-diphosphate pyrophosphatase
VLAAVVERGARVHDEARITRLGRGVDASRCLRDDAIDRTIDAVRDLAAGARALGAERVVGVGTSALRDAANRDVFVERARAILDAFDVIDGAREAALTLRGALFGLPEVTAPVTVVDIGGGSTEIVRGVRSVVSVATSIDVGSVRLTERHGSSLVAMRAEIADAMRAVSIELPLVLVAGTATNVAAVALGRDLARGAPSPHGATISSIDLRRAIARITTATPDERRTMIGIEHGREDVIAAGALIVEHVLDRSNATEVTISDGGVRFGLALELLDA